MTSQIVSATIDENYPIAGQDNDSQGFRNNFSIIKDGLATANSEITNLQLNTPKLNVANNFNGALIDNAQTNRLYGTVFSIRETVGTTVIDYANGEYQTVGIGGNHSLRFTGFPQKEGENGKYSKIRLELKPTAGVPPQGWNVSLLAANGGSVTGTVGFDQVGNNPVINIGNDIELATVVEAWTTNGLDFFVGLVGAYNAELNLESLTDVTLTTLSTGQILTYNGTSWVNGTVTVDIGSISSLEAVGDVSYVDLAAGDILKWNGTTWSGANDPTVTELDDIPNVDVESAVLGNLLKYDGTDWVNDTLNLNDLTDVVIDTLNTNHVLKYNGANWINTALMIGELGNVTTSSPVEGDILRYDVDGSTWKNEKDPNLHIYAVTLPTVFDGDDGYILDGSEIVDGLLTFHVGNIYRFNLSSPNNAQSRLSFSTTADGSQPYTTNVRNFGTAGQPGSYVEIQITKDTPNPIYIYGGAGTVAGHPHPLGQNVPIPVIKTAFYTGSENLTSSDVSLIRSTSYFSSDQVVDVTVGGTNNNYSIFPTISFAPPSSGVTATGTVRAGVVSVSVANAGTGYTVGNVLTIVGGTGTAATITVTAITGGGATGPIDTVSVTTAGNYSALADLTDLTVTGGTGSSALITITALMINSVVITEPGSGYTSAPAITDTPDGNATLTALTNLGTATLAAGVEGQVKTFAMYAGSQGLIITVSSPAWGGAGTITFDTVGQACTLQYINGKWFCIGNNGAVFA
jgi:hypothetical protein